MVKIIGLFAIVFVYYCEINAELYNLEYRKTATGDVGRILSSKKMFAGNKSGGTGLRANAAQPNAKFTTRFRENIRDPHKEYVLRNGEARNNDLEHLVVKNCRFKRSYRDEENKQIDAHDSESKKPKNKRCHHHLGRKMNENHDSTRNKKTKRYNNYTKRINTEEKDNEDKNKKHHYHSGRNKNNNSRINKKTKRYKKEDRHHHKDKKLNKEKNHSGKRKRDKNHSKYSDHPKDMSMSHKREKDHINKKKQAKDKSKDKQREKNMDRNKHVATGRPMRISKMGMMNLDDENVQKYNNKQLLNKSHYKQREKSKHTIDTSKAAVGMTGLGAAGFAALVEKSLASIKGPKPQLEYVLTSMTSPKLQPEQVLTSMISPKPPPEPLHEREVVWKKKLIERERLNLRTQEKIRQWTLNPCHQRRGWKVTDNFSPRHLLRLFYENSVCAIIENDFRVTRMLPLSLHKQEVKGKERLRQKSESESPAGLPTWNLSPYAITAQMELLMKEFPTVNATIWKSGRTVEYNDIVLVSITAKKDDETNFRVKESKYIDDVPEKKIIFIVHGLTVMGLNYMTSLVKISELKLLLSYYFKHLDKFNFFLMPLANPDGYSASLSGDAILYPRGYTETQSDDDKYIDIKGEVDEAMKNASFRVMTATVDTLSNWYGVVSGTSVDYAATVYGIPYAMEFVMQVYETESLNNNALTEIWSRLIDAAFNTMWNSLQEGSDARRFG